jgi:hypothetical protein
VRDGAQSRLRFREQSIGGDARALRLDSRERKHRAQVRDHNARDDTRRRIHHRDIEAGWIRQRFHKQWRDGPHRDEQSR